MIVNFFKPSITDKETKAVLEVLKSGWLTFGKKTEEFEEKFAEYINAPYCVAVDNCTAALTLACLYRRAKKSFNSHQPVVYVPSFTCAATYIAPFHSGYTVKFNDLRNDKSYLMNNDNQDEAMYYIPVHYAGKYCKIKPKHKILVEDSAHRIVKNGFTGNLQAYSFYVTKNITTGEGGMIACRTKSEHDWFKKARLYGNSKAIYERSKMYQSGKDYWWFESEFAGWKANTTDIASALGLIQLSRLDELNEERRRVAERYNDAFDLYIERDPWHLYPILVNERDKFMYYMKDQGIHCSVHFPPLHMMKAFKQKNCSLPVTEFTYKHIVSLPLYPYMPIRQQDYVIKHVLKWFNKHGYCSIHA